MSLAACPFLIMEVEERGIAFLPDYVADFPTTLLYSR